MGRSGIMKVGRKEKVKPVKAQNADHSITEPRKWSKGGNNSHTRLREARQTGLELTLNTYASAEREDVREVENTGSSRI